jgi:microcystin-dependent protein
MPYPPPVPPATRTNATVMATNHPADHNAISAALTEILNHIATLEASIYPIGTITMCGADIAPGNHEFCRGQLLSKATYPEVFALLGTKFGPGDASNFTMPSFMGRGPMGHWPGGTWAATMGAFIGSPDNSIPPHDHNIAHQHNVNGTTGSAGAHAHSGAAGPLVQALGSGIHVTEGGAGPAFYAGWTSTDTAPDHQHAFATVTTGGPTNSGGANGAVSVTNANISPGTVVNFVMRMH